MANKNQWSNMNFQQIMMQQANQKLNTPVYCRYCGHDINQPSRKSSFNATGSNTGNYASDWELENNAHSSCYQKNRRR